MLRAFCVALGAAVLVGQAAVAVAADPPKLDNYGDPLPAGAVLRLGTERLRAQHGFCWMPDGKTLVTASDCQLWFWNITDGKLLKSLPVGPSERSYKLASSADGVKLVCANEEGDLAVFDLTSGMQRVRLAPTASRGNEVHAMALAPNGASLITGNYDGIVQLWDVDTLVAKERLDFGKPPRERPCIAYSHDSRLVAVGMGRKILLFQIDGLVKPTTIEEAHGNSILSVAFTRDNKRLVSTGAGKFEKVTTATGKSYSRSTPELRVWDVAERRLLTDVKHPAGVETPGKMALGTDDNTVVTIHRDQSLVWDLSQQKVVRTFDGQPNRYGPSMIDVAIDPTGAYVAADLFESHIRVWNLSTGQPQLAPEARHSGYMMALAWSPDGTVIATGSWDQSVRLWDSKTGALLHTMKRGYDIVKSVAFTADGKRIASAGHDFDMDDLKYIGALRVFRVADGQVVLEQALPSRADCIAISNDSTKIAVGISGIEDEMEGPPQFLLLDATSGKKLAQFDAFARPVVAIGWSPDDRTLYAAARDNSLRQINVAAKTEFSLVNAPHDAEAMGELRRGSLESAVFLPASAEAITASRFPPFIHRWNLNTGKRAWSIEGPDASMRRIALSPDGRLVAGVWTRSRSGEPRLSGLGLWDVATQRKVLEMDLNGADPYSLAFAPDGRRIATGFANGTALVWDVSAAREKFDNQP